MTFQEHLDRLLDGPPPPLPSVLPDNGHHDWFVASHTLPPVAGLPAVHAADPCEPPPQPAPTRRRLWSERQDNALDVFRSLGVSLAPNPSLSAVRRAWRQLARALHPDLAASTASGAAFGRAAAAWHILQEGPAIELGDGSFRAGL